MSQYPETVDMPMIGITIPVDLLKNLDLSIIQEVGQTFDM